GSGSPGTGRNLWMGSAAQDNQGNSAVGFSASSTTLFPSMIWAGRLVSDPANTLGQGEANVVAGTGSQLGSSNRWGDYSAMSVDPSDDCTFFYTQEYYVTSNSFDWATSVAKFAYPSCTPGPRGTISGTVTDCVTGLPLAGAVVTDGLGHVRVTDASGTYAIVVAPGPYTLTVTKPGFTSGGGPVSVFNGSTVTLDVCLTGIPALELASTTLVAESCQPPNGVLDPGETVTVSFCIRNTGGGETSALVGTLGATGGVVDPPAPADYGQVSAGGAPVCRDLVFTVDPALVCGASVTATLALQDGATSLGSIDAVFPTGSPLVVYTQGFNVVPPALPAGWTASNDAGGAPLWATTSTTPDSGLGAAFVADPATVSDKSLYSPPLAVATPYARVSFRSSYGLETDFDGGVLEISIGGGPFADIVAAGGSFVAGGYTATLSPSGNPLAGRAAWTGTTGGYVTTTALLPASAAGTSIVLRWRMGSDNGISGTGWWVDTISLSDGVTCCSAIAPVALAVDVHPANPPANLNGVWEPGETVAVEPSWANNTASVVSFGGTASNLAGPSGATYTIVDGTAAYAAIGSGAVGSCAAASDCYAFSVDAPATRPALHWDATFDETVSAGPSKTWTLHIGESFTDVTLANPFYPFVEDIFHHGITGGCGVGIYCPDSSVTRAQMAVFILKAEHGSDFVPTACTGVFADVPCPSLFADWIETLATEGVTAGCGGGDYCPDTAVTRAQMAVFLLKGKNGASYAPPACTGVFTDVPCPDGFAVDFIEELAHEGVTAGCGGGDYCPNAPNTRGQMAVFLAKTFGLLLYGP
ncbi:MAG TPA: carboxypeptidase regulatory-like domain-containing protein, partial [Thermoanaerobaculia bacterium]|nr:carboxypeptidase regulatory-like domain-containing protein [Thermoanaerobaculia bacterium]